jgi:hypothetical protein
MSLMTYADARPWVEAVRTELLAGHMPPSTVEIGRFRNAPRLSGRELDVMLTWATGGSPEGDPARRPPPVTPQNEWPLGPPDVVLPLPAGGLAASEYEATREFTLPAGAAAGGAVRAVDFRPGARDIVRSAVVFAGPSRILAAWAPGQLLPPVDGGVAWRLPDGSALLVRVHYRKTWTNERRAVADASAVGLYFARPNAPDVRSITLESEPVAPESGREIRFAKALADDVEALAVVPDPSLGNVALTVIASAGEGPARTLARLRLQAGWSGRYWFDTPVPLAQGSRVEVIAQLGEPDRLRPPAATAHPVRLAEGSTVRLTLEGVSVR